MNPLDLYALVKKKPCYLSSKKKQKRQNYMTFHVSGFNTISPIVFDESLQSSVRPKNVYRIWFCFRMLKA